MDKTKQEYLKELCAKLDAAQRKVREGAAELDNILGNINYSLLPTGIDISGMYNSFADSVDAFDITYNPKDFDPKYAEGIDVTKWQPSSNLGYC